MDWANPDQVPADIFRRARSLVPPKSVRASIWNWRWMTASAAAACLVLLVVFIALRFGARQAVSGPNEPLVAQQHQPDAGPGAKFAATPRGLPRRSPA